MDLVKKFKLNTTDFQVYFDNDKKTYVALNMETGEKTNVGVLGTFLQMGILKPLEEPEKRDELLQKLQQLEEKISGLVQAVNSINSNSVGKNVETRKESVEDTGEEINERVEERKPKSEVAEEIMEKTLNKLSKEKRKASKESEEELKNWLDI